MKFITKEPIDKGWSGDKKYCVTDENGTRYLLQYIDGIPFKLKKRL